MLLQPPSSPTSHPTSWARRLSEGEWQSWYLNTLQEAMSRSSSSPYLRHTWLLPSSCLQALRAAMEEKW